MLNLQLSVSPVHTNQELQSNNPKSQMSNKKTTMDPTITKAHLHLELGTSQCY